MVAILDFQKLLAAINVNSPAGKDLRREDFTCSLYYRIKDARTSVRLLERQQIQGIQGVVKPDWTNVYELSLKALLTQTKDLEIVVWLIEALLRIHGFAGLCDGFRLARELIILYWDELYPMPDDDGLATRLAPLTGLNGEETDGTLIVPIALVPLTQGNSIGPVSLWQYQQALEINKITDLDKRKHRLAAGAFTSEMISQAVAETSTVFFINLLHELTSCINEFKELINTLAQKAGQEAPPSSRILAQLSACVECIHIIAKENLSTKSLLDTNSSEIISNNIFAEANTSTNLAINHVNNYSNNHIQTSQDLSQTREQIIASLLYAADFFRRTEPHSPLPYLLERAVKWSKQPLPSLMKELIKDEQALGYFCNLTGVVIAE